VSRQPATPTARPTEPPCTRPCSSGPRAPLPAHPAARPGALPSRPSRVAQPRAQSRACLASLTPSGPRPSSATAPAQAPATGPGRGAACRSGAPTPPLASPIGPGCSRQADRAQPCSTRHLYVSDRRRPWKPAEPRPTPSRGAPAAAPSSRHPDGFVHRCHHCGYVGCHGHHRCHHQPWHAPPHRPCCDQRQPRPWRAPYLAGLGPLHAAPPPYMSFTSPAALVTVRVLLHDDQLIRGMFVSFDPVWNPILRDCVEVHPQVGCHVPGPLVSPRAAIASLAVEPMSSPSLPCASIGAPSLALSAHTVPSPPPPPRTTTDWVVDSGASFHTTPTTSSLLHSHPTPPRTSYLHRRRQRFHPPGHLSRYIGSSRTILP
jgi:small nuclear ribonucleoprotein (snRNP)-like protein